MVADLQNNTRHISLFKAIVLVAIVVVQVVRLSGTSFVLYYQFHTLVISQQQSYLLDENDRCVCNQPTTTPVENVTEFEDFDDDEPRFVEEDEIPRSQTGYLNMVRNDTILASVAALEVATTSTFFWIVVGPLSSAFGIRHWIRWMINMRILYMRMIWTITAIVYCVVVYHYKIEMYKLYENQPEKQAQYEVIPAWFVMLAFSCFEYLFLGLLECALKIISFDKVVNKIKKSSKKLPKCWGKVQVYSYYLCLFAYALRNFSLSLYFGLLSVFISYDDLIVKNRLSGITLILQIYLAMIRGRFYGMFMHAFMSNFVVEEDDDMFKEIKQEVDSDQLAVDQAENFNDLAEKSLLEEKQINDSPAANVATTVV